jgi:hypothetical protein
MSRRNRLETITKEPMLSNYLKYYIINLDYDGHSSWKISREDFYMEKINCVEINKPLTLFLISGLFVIGLFVMNTQAVAMSPNKVPGNYTLSKEFLNWSNAPAITQEQKDNALKIASKTTVYKEYIKYPHSSFTYDWSYPYTGAIHLETIINSSQYNGILYFTINNSTVSNDGFNNMKENNAINNILMKDTLVMPTAKNSTSMVALTTIQGVDGLGTGWSSKPDCNSNATICTDSLVSFWNAWGYTANKMEGSDDTITNIINYFKSDDSLCFYNNIGDSDAQYDGDPCNNLKLYNGFLSASTISSLSPDNGLYGDDIFINSCDSFDDPLKSAFLTHSPKFYVGGKKNLPALSAYTAKDFWVYYLGYGQSVSVALTSAQQATGIAGQNYYGFVGN